MVGLSQGMASFSVPPHWPGKDAGVGYLDGLWKSALGKGFWESWSKLSCQSNMKGEEEGKRHRARKEMKDPGWGGHLEGPGWAPEMEPYQVQGLSVVCKWKKPSSDWLRFFKKWGWRNIYPQHKSFECLWTLGNTGLRCSSDKTRLVPLDGGFLLHQDPPTPPRVMADGPPHLQT